MELSPSSEANSHSASPHFVEPEDSLPCSQDPVNSEALCNIL